MKENGLRNKDKWEELKKQPYFLEEESFQK